MANLPIIREDQVVDDRHDESNNYCCGKADCPCADQFWIDMGMASEQDETGTHPPDCRCAWCEPYEPPYTRADQEADQATADYCDEVQRRQETRQCSDGSWW